MVCILFILVGGELERDDKSSPRNFQPDSSRKPAISSKAKDSSYLFAILVGRLLEWMADGRPMVTSNSGIGSQGCRFEPCRVQTKSYSHFTGDFSSITLHNQKRVP